MITITKEFTKEQLIEQAKKNIEVLRGAVERVPGASDAAVIHLKLAEITLASLEAEPNFNINGNSPVTPDGWISCSERMPKKNQNVLISVNFDSDLVEPLICSARNTGSTFRRGQATIKPGNGIEQATHWMPLPEPPQQDGK